MTPSEDEVRGPRVYRVFARGEPPDRSDRWYLHGAFYDLQQAIDFATTLQGAFIC